MTPVRLLVAVILLLPAACGSMLPAPPAPPQLFRLTPLAPAADAGPPIAVQLVVSVPVAPAALDTARIALSRSPNSIDYFANAAWTDRAPLMMQSLVVESLENAGRIRVVARDSAALRADATLMVDLRRFEAEYDGDGPPEIHVRLDCRLIKMPERNVLGVRSFDGAARAKENETPAIVVGFDAAFHTAMGQIATWTAQTLAAMPR